MKFEQDFRYIFQDAIQQAYHSSVAEIPGNLTRQMIKKLNLFFIVHRTVYLLHMYVAFCMEFILLKSTYMKKT